MRLAFTLMLIATIACGHKPPTTGGTGPASGSGTGTAAETGSGAGTATGAGTGADDGAGAASLSKDECVAMLGHIVDVGMAEKRRTMKPDDAPSDEDVVKARKVVVDKSLQECLQSVSRAQYACAMKAQSPDDMGACNKP